jgi:signal transduction histidine kinase
MTHGTGLGLTLIEDVVAAHGGSVNVESKCETLDSETTVTMHLPVEAHTSLDA